MAVVLMDIASIYIGSAGNPIISTGQSKTLILDQTASISVFGLDPTISAYRSRSIVFDIAEVGVSAEPFIFKVSVKREPRVKTPPPRRTWQARLGAKMDDIYAKTMDNSISMASHPLDMVRVKVNRDERTQDIISRTVVANDMMPIFFDKPLEALPFRRLEYDDSDVVIMTVDGTDLKEITAKCPISERLNRGDLLFRIIRDDYSERPVVLVLQVKDELGVVGFSKVIQVNYVLSYYDEKLPASIIDAVIDSTVKREEVQW